MEEPPGSSRWTRVGSGSCLGLWRNRSLCGWSDLGFGLCRMTCKHFSGATALCELARAASTPLSRLCDLVVADFQREGEYTTLARWIAACVAAVEFGQSVLGTNGYLWLDSFPVGPLYLSWTAPFPPMAGLKSAFSWLRNNGILADAFRTDIKFSRQTHDIRTPVYILVHPSGWQEGWKTAPAFWFGQRSASVLV